MPSKVSPLLPTPKMFSYKRELAGIVDTITLQPNEEEPLRKKRIDFASFLLEYLIAHGYTDEAMDKI